MRAQKAAEQHPVQAAIVDFDARIDRLLDRLRGRTVPDRVMYTATDLGDFSLIWHILSVARGLRRGGDLRGTMRLVTFLGVESAIVNGPVKSLFRRARPVSDVPRPHRLRTPRTTSFPSGHASAATVFALTASEDDSWAPVYVGLAALVATSRIHVRIHHASDVAGGVAVGLVIGTALRKWWPADRALPHPLPTRNDER